MRMHTAWYCGAAAFLLAATPGWAQRFETLNGPPVQMQPYVGEPGAPDVTVTTGSPAFAGLDSGTGASAGNADNGDTSTLTVTSAGSSEALNTMLGKSWGAQVAANAQSLGVNASAVAATCVVESGCGANVGNGSGAQGVFQMYSAAYKEGLNTALTTNPALSSQIVSGSAGVNDPVTAGIAATGYLMQANQALQNAGVQNPTVMDARSYYEFGPKYGAAVAQADPSALMSDILPASFLSNNNISSSMTVDQWRASVAGKIGTAATQPVLG